MAIDIVNISIIVSVKSSHFVNFVDKVGSAIYIQQQKDLSIIDSYFVDCVATSFVHVVTRNGSGGAILARVNNCFCDRISFIRCKGVKKGSSLLVLGSNSHFGVWRQISCTQSEGSEGLYYDYSSLHMRKFNVSYDGSVYCVGTGGTPPECDVKYFLCEDSKPGANFLSFSVGTGRYSIGSIVVKNLKSSQYIFHVSWNPIEMKNINVINCTGNLLITTENVFCTFDDSFLGSGLFINYTVRTGNNVTFEDGVNILKDIDFREPYITKCYIGRSGFTKYKLSLSLSSFLISVVFN